MEITDLPQGKKIILFDGVCNLCDSFIQYVIRRDKRDVFRFAVQQSEIGRKILKHIGIDPEKTDSVVLYEPGIAYFTKSSAGAEIAKSLSGIGRLDILNRIFPRVFSDKFYDIIAKNRYKWFGKKDNCMIPTAEMRAKFLE